MSRVFDVLFNDGQDEGTDKIALPDGKFRRLQNCRLTRDGRIEPRQNYVSLTNGVVPLSFSRFRAFDLTTYENRLVALGSPDSVSTTPTYPIGYFTLTQAANGVWTQHLGADISPISSLQLLWQNPSGPLAHQYDIAYTNGQLCVVQFDSNSVNAVLTLTRILVSTGAVLARETHTAIAAGRVCACGNTFVLVMRSSGGALVCRTLDTSTTATAFGGSTTLEASPLLLALNVAFDLTSLTSTDFLVSYPMTTPRVRLRRYAAASLGAPVWTLDVGAVAGHSAVIGNSTDLISLAITNGNNVELRTVSLAGAVTVGPTNVLGPAATPATANATAPTALTFTTNVNTASRVLVMCSAAPAGGGGLDVDNIWTTRSTAAHANTGSGRAGNVRTTSKPFVIDNQLTTGKAAFAFGALTVGGNTSSTNQFFAAAVHGIQTQDFCAARFGYGVTDRSSALGTFLDNGGRSSVATDGAGNFWGCACQLQQNDIGAQTAGTLQVFKIVAGTNARRQTAEMQGALYSTGGFVSYWDGGFGSSESGFLDTPAIDSFAAAAAGGLTLLATYTYILTYEYTDGKGNLHRSTPSDPLTLTLTGANNQVTLQASTPHSIRRAAQNSNAAGCQIVAWRNTPGDSVFYRVAQTQLSSNPTVNAYADRIAVVDGMSDVTAQTREVLYIYSQKPTANVAPQPCKFAAAGRDRMIYGGLVDPYMIAFSQIVFPNEPVETASPNNFAYTLRLPEPCTGVAVSRDQYIAFSDSAIYAIPGAGPQRNGTGEFFSPQPLDTDVGCIDWRSIVTCGKGVFFQGDTDKIFLLGESAPQWIGQPVRDTLALYPTIVGSCLCTATQRVVFACSNVAGNDGVLLIYDLRKQIWSVDTIGQGLLSVVEYLGRLAYAGADGLVYLENLPGVFSGALPSVRIDTGSFKLFPANGNGSLIDVVLSGTYIGDCTVEGFISYDDGKNWVSMGQQACTTANLFNRHPASGAAVVTGDAITVRFQPNLREISNRFALRFDITNGTDNGGIWSHMVSLEVEAQEFATRQPARNQR